MIGKIYEAPRDVIESGTFIIVAVDSDPFYNASRRPWFLQVRELRDGKKFGPWLPVTHKEFFEWNPDATVTKEQRLASGNSGRVTEPC